MIWHRRVLAFGLLLALLALTQGSHAQFNSFPPGTFLGHGARDASGGGPPAYTGPLDIVSGNKGWWSASRAASSADRGNKLVNACNPGDATCADLSSDATTGKLVVSSIGGVSCSEAISTGTYSSVTGAVVLTTSLSASLSSGNIFALTALTGTGSIASLTGQWTATIGTAGTTVNFTAPTGLTLTITGGTVSVCTIKTMYDRSGAAQCSAAACDGLQPGISNRAVLGIGCVSTITCAVFSVANNSYYESTNVITTFSQPITMSSVVERLNNFTTAQGILFIADDINYFDAVANQAAMYAGSVATLAGVADSAFHAMQAIFNGASSNLYVDGTANTVNPGGSTGSLQVYIGNNQSVTAPLGGFLYETGVWNIAFSTTGGGQASQMNTNQMSFY